MVFLICSLLILNCGQVYGSVSAQHAMGTLELPSPPQRVVALNWTAVEMLLSLDVVPVGVASIKGYRQWQSNHPELPEGITELGSRSQVNLKAIAALKPDLIVGYPWRHRSVYEALSKIAPTALFQQYPMSGEKDFRYFDVMQKNFVQLSRLLDKEEKAHLLIRQMRVDLDNARTRLAETGFTGEQIVIAKAIGMGLGVRVFSPESLAGTIASELGLINRWKTSIPGRDFSHIQLRELAAFQDTHMFMVGGLTDNAQQLTDSSLWPHLPFVKSHKLYSTPQLWSFGGPVSATRMATTITQTLIEQAPQSTGQGL
ncbi:ABC transporter substrate-binding protein [Hahella ganghwensis]|uniref:ABC transporter substrate-binding protein n=1 Tax=Hahella ganghwensis TaxID=286420 RepID=UPI0003720AFF|nr:iron-siderophore ABC transporter substrate-binding protein [Hahella ganghwensis]